MYKETKLFFIKCETSMHAGSGSELGIVDLPIQRERHTGYPKIESSSLKGSIRQAFEEKNANDVEYQSNIHRVFGYDDYDKGKYEAFKEKESQEFCSAIAFTDARILLFPVKSMKGVFAWITSKNVLKRFKNDLSLTGTQADFDLPDDDNCYIFSNNLEISGQNIVLEEYTFKVNKNDKYSKLPDVLGNLIFKDDEFNKKQLKDKLVILDDTSFKDFVTLSTEVITRTKIDNKTGTVEQGALFNEEYLPPETIMYSIVMTSPIFAKNKGNLFSNNTSKAVMNFFEENIPEVIQIGGNYTLGKGLTRIILEKENK